MSKLSKDNLVWLDLEMSGLAVDREVILEIATIVTNSDLTVLEEGPSLVIKQEDHYLDNMDEWNTRQHTKSGLSDRVRSSQISIREAEEQTLAFISQYVPQGVSPICGNSICLDRQFLYRQMPKLHSHFHYRNLDVSTVKELARRWAPEMAKGMVKENCHLALSDIRESINELRYYQEHFFKL